MAKKGNTTKGKATAATESKTAEKPESKTTESVTETVAVTEKAIIEALENAETAADSVSPENLTRDDAPKVLMAAFKLEKKVVSVSGFVLRCGREFQREAMAEVNDVASAEKVVTAAMKAFRDWCDKTESTVQTEAGMRWLKDRDYPIQMSKTGDKIILPTAWRTGKSITGKMLSKGLIITDDMTPYQAKKATTPAPVTEPSGQPEKADEKTALGLTQITSATMLHFVESLESNPAEQARVAEEFATLVADLIESHSDAPNVTEKAPQPAAAKAANS